MEPLFYPDPKSYQAEICSFKQPNIVQSVQDIKPTVRKDLLAIIKRIYYCLIFIIILTLKLFTIYTNNKVPTKVNTKQSLAWFGVEMSTLS